jgi:hypothetical protein
MRSGAMLGQVDVSPAGGRFVASFTGLLEGDYVVFELQGPAHPDSLGVMGLR